MKRAAKRMIFRNKPLLVIMAASLFGNCAFQLKVAVNTYYGDLRARQITAP
jgi:Na+/melibiose symporter-like transporter